MSTHPNSDSAVNIGPARDGYGRVIVSGLRRAFSIDLRTIALFRIVIGALIIVDLIWRGRDFVAFLTDNGVMPRAAMRGYHGDWAWSLYFIDGGVALNLLLVAVTAVAALALSLGYRSRLMALACWLLLLSLHNRAGLINTGADNLLRLLVFWAMFLPLGARWSLDRALRKDLGSDSGPGPAPSEAYFGMASVAILLQVMYVYWVGALLKTGDAWQQSYNAIYFALSSEHLSTAAGTWVLENLTGLLPALTVFVYWLELLGPLALIAPVALLWLRLPVLVSLIAMHIGFAVFLSVGLFPYVSIASLLLFVPPQVWDRFGATSSSEFSTTTVNSRPAQLVLLYAMIYVLNINISMFSNSLLVMPHTVDQLLLNGFGLRQNWSMFAPNSNRLTLWPVVRGVTADGQPVDLFHDAVGEPPVTKPDSLHNNFSSFRWRKYFSRIYKNRYKKWRKDYAQFQCQRWNQAVVASHPQRLTELSVAVGRQWTELDLSRRLIAARQLGRYSCPR